MTLLHQCSLIFLSAEIIEWLNEERYSEETDIQLLNRKLSKLMKLENSGL